MDSIVHAIDNTFCVRSHLGIRSTCVHHRPAGNSRQETGDSRQKGGEGEQR